MRLSDLYPDRPACRAKFAERFWSKVDVRGEDDCWPWLASVMKPQYRSPGGYGRFGVGGNGYQGSHRVAYMMAHGEVPDDLAVCHSCDNPPCCNPRHLWIGTKIENNADRDRKGRTRNKALPGAMNGRAKLTESDVRAIRRRRAAGETLVVLAAEYDVTTASVSHAALGRTWKEIS